jgi:hypothetical protein
MTVPIGSIVYLTSCVIKAKVTAEATMPDTPDMFGAELEVMDDRGAMDLSNVTGKPGRDGDAQFALRRGDNIFIDTLAELPDDLTDDDEDVGKYYIISTKDGQGNITEQWAYVWYGVDQGYVKTYMGSQGVPGPIPRIQPTVKLIDPALEPFIDTGGTTLVPNWQINLNVQRGETGWNRPGVDENNQAFPTRWFYQFPDYDGDPAPSTNMVLMCTADYNDQGDNIWRPANLLALAPRVYSVPETAFTSHTGSFQGIATDEDVNIATILIPAQPFDWTPVVWGHIGGTNQGLLGLRDQTMQIGCTVRLGPKRNLISRGFDLGIGQVNLMPHYSTPQRPTKAIGPGSNYCVIKANHTDQTLSTLHVDLHNDGRFGFFDYYRENSQLFIMVVPIDAYRSYTRTTRRVS